MFEVIRDPDPRLNALSVRNISRLFVTGGNGQILYLTLPEARALVEALMTETMRINLFTEEVDHED